MKHTIDLAKKLIQIPSVTSDVQNAVAVLEIAKKELEGFAYKEYVNHSVPSLLFRNRKESKNFKIILNAHLDVVSGNLQQFQPYERDGKLYGRGAYDMKAAGAVMITVFKELAHTVSYPLGLQLVTDEELASYTGTNYHLKQGIHTEFAIIGECGNNLSIVHENKGIITAELTASGQSAHGGYPWKGKNAILRMFEVIALLQKHFPTPKVETFDTTLTVSQITTNNKTWNKVPDNCTATLDVRFSKKDYTTVRSQIQSLLPDDITLELLQTRNPHYTDPQNPYVLALKKAGQDVLKSEIAIKKTYGGSDATFFSAAGMDAVEFGPIGSGQHDDNEWVDLRSLEVYKSILKTFLLNIR